MFMPQSNSADFLVIGAGCVGLRIAIELRSRHPDCRVLVIDKENMLAGHASGRNSGVLHAGFYYPADSLKAKLCAQGNRGLTEYCIERKLAINRCGKLVVATKESDVEGLETLMDRAKQSGIDLSPVDPDYAKHIEPHANAPYGGLFSPTTSTVNPIEVMAAYRDEALDRGVEVVLGEAFVRRRPDGVLTSMRSIACGYVVNAGGLQADRIAKSFGFGQNYAILPFRGNYLYAAQSLPVRACIYPVPNLRNPFLGVHITVASDGKVKLGPTAFPCLWREQYGGMANFRPAEALPIAGLSLRLMLAGAFNLRALAVQEARKQFKRNLIHEASGLSPIVDTCRYRWGRPGIRAQLVDRKAKSLVMDFCLEGDGQSIHVLNAVSPALTCSIPFGRLVADEIERRMREF